MNKEEILAMEAGEELDKVVAESFGYEVKSWETFQDKPIYRYRVPSQYGEVWELLLKYSTNISVAWQVVEELDLLNRHNLSKWENTWYIFDEGPSGELTIYGEGKDAPEAICKAALIIIHSGNNV